MKTNFSILKTSVYATFGFLSLFLTSCGSYQNVSSDERDGIYGGSGRSENVQSNSQSNQYKNYFGSLQENNEPDQIFTDVENYSSTNYDNTDRNTEEYNGYAGWGSNPQNVTVNVYDNSWGAGWGWNNYWYSGYWGWNLGWGWNSWYGPAYYGWGYYPYPYYAYGYGGWNHYYPYYGHWNNGYYGNGYAYYNGRRSDGYRNVINPGRNSYYNGTRNTRSYNNSTRYYSGTRNNGTYNPSTRNNGVRTYDYSNPRTRAQQAPSTRNNSYSTPRNNPSVRNQPSQSTPRNYAPSTRSNNYSAPSRSSSGGSGSYGGGGRSGGGRR